MRESFFNHFDFKLDRVEQYNASVRISVRKGYMNMTCFETWNNFGLPSTQALMGILASPFYRYISNVLIHGCQSHHCLCMTEHRE